ncbi:MAG TPA: copper resistance protein CopC [Ktedonobacteraceae bacterium]
MHRTRSLLKILLAAFASLGLLCVTAVAVSAAPAQPARPFHAKVLSSDPAIGSTIAQAPTKVTVLAAENINPDPAKSNLQVYGPSTDASDTLISQGNAQISLSKQKQMSISITPNTGHTTGVYVVFWKTVSADDGDAAAGSFSFTVNPAGASATPVATSVTKTAPTNPGSGSTTSASGAPIWVPIVVALVALLLGLGAGFGLGRRQPASSSFRTMRASVAQDNKEEVTRP